MRYIASAQEMQEIDNTTINKTGIPGLVLMERAALAVVEEITKRYKNDASCLVVVESGNNGGDGLAVARILLEKGYNVDIYHINQVKKETDSFTVQKNILHNMGVDIMTAENSSICSTDILFNNKNYDIIVDAVFGVGLKRNIEGIHKLIIEKLNSMAGYKVAIDVPSGVNATTGKIMGTCIRTDLTVTMGLTKAGLVLYPGQDMAGEVIVKDIGFPKSVVQNVSPAAFTYDEADLSRIPARRNDSNKGTYGRIAIIAGSSSMSGAATLSVKAAYRMGAGLVKIYTHENNRQIIGCTVPEAIMMTPHLLLHVQKMP
jgi:NAD(P)H-hydrate epimerase